MTTVSSPAATRAFWCWTASHAFIPLRKAGSGAGCIADGLDGQRRALAIAVVYISFCRDFPWGSPYAASGWKIGSFDLTGRASGSSIGMPMLLLQLRGSRLGLPVDVLADVEPSMASQ
ncbi:hypothetical protein DIPPA_09578 [Diplonema papillatum]|nr:hypothetical protein DIPPA_09578 [Diplonema papillatum]